MGAWARIKRARWYMWIVVPLAICGAYSLSGECFMFYWSWKGYRYERGVAISEGLNAPTFAEYRKAKRVGLDPLSGQLFGRNLCRSGEKAITELLPSDEQPAARATLIAFKAQVGLVSDADTMLIAERIDEVHLILKDPKHHTPDELRAWLSRVNEFADMKAAYKYEP